jgi:hypothetical protein
MNLIEYLNWKYVLLLLVLLFLLFGNSGTTKNQIAGMYDESIELLKNIK